MSSGHQVTFKYALGEEIRHRDTGLAGVITHQTNESRGPGYWVAYADAHGVIHQDFIPEVDADAGL